MTSSPPSQYHASGGTKATKKRNAVQQQIPPASISPLVPVPQPNDLFADTPYTDGQLTEINHFLGHYFDNAPPYIPSANEIGGEVKQDLMHLDDSTAAQLAHATAQPGRQKIVPLAPLNVPPTTIPDHDNHPYIHRPLDMEMHDLRLPGQGSSTISNFQTTKKELDSISPTCIDPRDLQRSTNSLPDIRDAIAAGSLSPTAGISYRPTMSVPSSSRSIRTFRSNGPFSAGVSVTSFEEFLPDDAFSPAASTTSVDSPKKKPRPKKQIDNEKNARAKMQIALLNLYNKLINIAPDYTRRGAADDVNKAADLIQTQDAEIRKQDAEIRKKDAEINTLTESNIRKDAEISALKQALLQSISLLAPGVYPMV